LYSKLISESKYTTKLAKLIDEYDDLVKLLNGTKANYTVFAPTDEAFEKIPHHGKKPSKEVLKSILLYHVSDDFYPAGRVLHSYTIPTLYVKSRVQSGWMGSARSSATVSRDTLEPKGSTLPAIPSPHKCVTNFVSEP
jgi:uncharacterized surface protein with fasciclin (FAS1) repeats